MQAARAFSRTRPQTPGPSLPVVDDGSDEEHDLDETLTDHDDSVIEEEGISGRHEFGSGTVAHWAVAALLTGWCDAS